MGRIRANCKGIFSWNQWYICDHSTWEAEAGGPWVWGRPGCLSCFSITVIKHHDEGNLQKKLFNWTYCFRAVEFVVAKQSHGRKNHWELIFGLANRKQRGHTRNGRSRLKSQIPQPTDIPPPTRPYLWILPSQFQQLGPKCSNTWACGSRSHSDHNIRLQSENLFLKQRAGR